MAYKIKLKQLHISGANNGDVVTFDSASGTWKAAAPSGGGSVPVRDDGVSIVTSPTALNFTGAGVTVTNNGGVATIDVPGGGSGSGPTNAGLKYTFFVNFTTGSPGNIDLANPVVGLPSGWAVSSVGNTTITITHNLSEDPVYWGVWGRLLNPSTVWQSRPTSATLEMEYDSAAEPRKITINGLTATSSGGSTTGAGMAKVVLIF